MQELPQSLPELKSLSAKEIENLWRRYFFTAQYSTKPVILALWYRIQCIINHCAVEDRHQVRLRKYQKSPEECLKKTAKYTLKFKAGTQIQRLYKGQKHIITVKDIGTFVYKENEYKTLSAIAMKICGKKVSGNHFFGLHNKSNKEVIDDAK